MPITTLTNCNCEVKLLKLKANYNERSKTFSLRYCNREIKLLKLKANYNSITESKLQGLL